MRRVCESYRRCLGDDLYRGYFDEVRMRMGEKTAEKTMQDTSEILPRPSEQQAP